MDDAQLARRLGAIEAQLRLLSERVGVDCPPFAGDGPPALPAEVVELARGGQETEAIGRLRALTGASLLEAKRAVDGFDR